MIQLKYTIRWEHIGDNFYGVSYSNKNELMPGVIVLNEVGYDIVKQLSIPTSQENIVQSLLAIYDTNSFELSNYVNHVLQYLKAQGLLSYSKK